MYNEEIKLQYLDTVASPEERAIKKSRLSKAAVYEELIGKDVSQMTIEEMCTMYSFFNLSSLVSLQMYHYAIQQYIKWCVDNGYADKAALEASSSILQDQLKQCISAFRRTSKYIGHDVIEDLTCLLPNPMDQAIVQGVYNGICGEGMQELILLHREHVDESVGMVGVPCLKGDGTIGINRTIMVPEDVIQIFLKAFAADTYTDLKFREWPLYGEGLIKNIYPPDTELTIEDEIRLSKRRIIEHIAKMKTAYKIGNLTVQALKISGIIHCITQTAEDLGMTKAQVVNSEHFNSIKEKYGIATDSKLFMKRYKDYLE